MKEEQEAIAQFVEGEENKRKQTMNTMTDGLVSNLHGNGEFTYHICFVRIQVIWNDLKVLNQSYNSAVRISKQFQKNQDSVLQDPFIGWRLFWREKTLL